MGRPGPQCAAGSVVCAPRESSPGACVGPAARPPHSRCAARTAIPAMASARTHTRSGWQAYIMSSSGSSYQCRNVVLPVASRRQEVWADDNPLCPPATRVHVGKLLHEWSQPRPSARHGSPGHAYRSRQRP
eukprot:scaffold1782_cov414-Prasinococcus_capsulatus_cf.AAC.26